MILGIAGNKGSRYQENCTVVFCERIFWNWCNITVMKNIFVSTVKPFIDNPTVPRHSNILCED